VLPCLSVAQYRTLVYKVRLLERIDPSGRTDGFEVRIEKT
jgi:hypothetical protein